MISGMGLLEPDLAQPGPTGSVRALPPPTGTGFPLRAVEAGRVRVFDVLNRVRFRANQQLLAARLSATNVAQPRGKRPPVKVEPGPGPDVTRAA